MEFNLKRLFTGLVLLIILFIFYFFEQDLIFLCVLISLVLYDLNYSKILKLNKLIPLIFIFLFIYYLSNNNLIFYFLFPCIIFFSIFIKRYTEYLFAISLFIFLFFCLELINLDRFSFYLLILLSFVNDTTAYIFGRFIKGPKITPIISPKKTYSGTVISFIVSFILILYFFNIGIFLSLIASFSFFLGDIYFSFIKRKYLLKDFSNLLIGHGGILDRLDSIFLVTYIFLFYIKLQ